MITKEQKAWRKLQPSWWPPVRVFARVAKYPSNSGELQAKRCSNVPCWLLQRPLDVTFVQPVIRPDDVDLVRRLTDGMNVLEPVAGGATRQASVRAGLEALVAGTPDIVLVHDAARPFASAALITRAIAAAERPAWRFRRYQ